MRGEGGVESAPLDLSSLHSQSIPISDLLVTGLAKCISKRVLCEVLVTNTDCCERREESNR